jgi:N-acyl-D-aspartate/D-glutamate deacylase
MPTHPIRRPCLIVGALCMCGLVLFDHEPKDHAPEAQPHVPIPGQTFAVGSNGGTAVAGPLTLLNGASTGPTSNGLVPTGYQ